MDRRRMNALTVMPVLFLAPAFLFFTVYVILPIFQSIYISFFEWDGLGDMTYVGVENYLEMFDDDRFYTSLKNNLLWLILLIQSVCVSPQQSRNGRRKKKKNVVERPLKRWSEEHER